MTPTPTPNCPLITVSNYVATGNNYYSFDVTNNLSSPITFYQIHLDWINSATLAQINFGASMIWYGNISSPLDTSIFEPAGNRSLNAGQTKTLLFQFTGKKHSSHTVLLYFDDGCILNAGTH
jgi:hypothetical protein